MDFYIKFCLFSKLGVIGWLTKQITKSKIVKRKFQGKLPQFYIGVSILKFEDSDQRFKVSWGGGGGGGEGHK